MNETTPPPFTGASTWPAPAAKINLEPPLHLPRLLVALFLAVVAVDVCFWHLDDQPGLSVAAFFAALSGIILANRESIRGRKTTFALLVLIAGAVTASAIETGVSNTLVFGVLVAALAGDTFFCDVESPWGRWLSQGVALIFAPGRVFWLNARMMEAAFRDRGGWAGKAMSGFLLTLPAVVLILVFGSLLASGNVIFGNWTNVFFDWFWKELGLFFDLGRIVFWFCAALLILPLLRPAMVSTRWWKWTESLPKLPGLIPTQGALFSSGLTLVVLNLLFLVANLADAAFLWSGQTLPAGVTYSEYVHHGVNSLIATVILSAFVLVVIFQQEARVAERKELKVLGMVWIAQNLFLLLSVTLRLKLYIEAFDMTVERLGVMIFLLVVAAGYGLLAIKLVRNKSLSWLVGGCVLAVVAILYVTQFLDLAGWSANYNVARWEKDRSRTLDTAYLLNLGPAAWPALRRASDDGVPPNGYTTPLSERLRNLKEEAPYVRLDLNDWREFSLRAWLNRSALDDKK